jgi:hypothetical protein
VSSTDNYYSLTLLANGASTGAFYSIVPTSNLQIAQGGVSVAPTAASATMVNIYPQELQIQSPPGSVYSGVTIITDAEKISGQVVASPPVNVEVTVTLYGAGGTKLGEYILEPGHDVGVFSFDTTRAHAMSASEALDVVKQALSRK